MLDYIWVNLPEVLISIGLTAIVALVILSMARDRKKGKGACGCGCESCPANAACHKK